MATMLGEAVRLVESGRFGEAERLLSRHATRKPDDAAAAYLLGYSLVRLGKPDRAVVFLERAASASPPQHDALVEYGCALFDCGRYEPGVAQLQRAVRAFPTSARAHTVLARMLLQGGLFVDAMECAMQAMKLAPEQAPPVSVFASCLAGLGRAEQAAEWFARADPADIVTRSNLCFALNAAGGIDPARILAEHRAAGALIAEHAPAGRPRQGDKDPNRRLRVGLASPDMRDHPVARFLAPLVAHLDRAGFELIAYSNAVLPDPTTHALRRRFDGWRDTAGLGDDALADLIRRDQVDVLIDLAGLTGGNRLAVFPARPAPVQMTYLGYPNTTGVPGVDYRIVDAVTDPPGCDAATERLIRLPGCLLCFEPPAGAPSVSEPPCLSPGAPVAFGSFNNPTKLSDATLALWRGVLEGVQGSVLVLKGKGLTEPKCRAALDRRLTQAGFGLSRVRVLDYRGRQHDHLASYAQIDLALDTHPYSGTMTTCEALWMGVPVLTLPGRTHASRVSASILSSAGCREWIADSPASLIAIAARLAGDRAGLAAVRRGLRARVQQSPLCDAPAFAAGFASAVRGAWREFCGVG
jgi:protein O-GlcNAc transferase